MSGPVRAAFSPNKSGVSWGFCARVSGEYAIDGAPRGRTPASLKTTNCLESINALVEERCAKVDHWQNSSQRHSWLATALLDIEPRLRKVMGYRHLPKLRAGLKRELKIDTATSKKKAA